MSKDKFIELLNLYIDGEIDPSEIVLLEAEIAENSEHRKIYNQYCRIHRASCLLGEQFKETASVYKERDPVVEIRKSSSWAYQLRKVVYPLGGIAAALVVALSVPSLLKKNESGIEGRVMSEISQTISPMETAQTSFEPTQVIPDIKNTAAVVRTESTDELMTLPVLAQVTVSSNDEKPTVGMDFSGGAVVSLDLPRKAYFISANWEPEIRLSNSTSPFNLTALSKPQAWSFQPVGNTLLRSRSQLLKPSPFINGTPIYQKETGQVRYDNLETISFQFQK